MYSLLWVTGIKCFFGYFVCLFFSFFHYLFMFLVWLFILMDNLSLKRHRVTMVFEIEGIREKRFPLLYCINSQSEVANETEGDSSSITWMKKDWYSQKIKWFSLTGAKKKKKSLWRMLNLTREMNRSSFWTSTTSSKMYADLFANGDL